MNRLNLFCVPFAGGSANIYNSWKKEFGNVVNLVPVELSGRGKRINEPLYNDFDEAAEDIYNNVKTYVDEPYAMFGHSMGGMLVFEVVHKIIERIGREPDFIVISGKNPPHIPLNSKVHSLEDREFLNELIKLGGINEEFLKHKELIEIFLPIMKSDFKITELYRYKKRKKFNFDLHILYGTMDELTTKEALEQWEKYTNQKCHFQCFNGNHFFIEDNKAEVITYLKSLTRKYWYSKSMQLSK